MESKIEKELKEVLIASSEKLKGEGLLDRFEEASKEFERLVSLGLAKKRGNNLISITDTHLHKSNVNGRESVQEFLSKNIYLSNI